MFTIRFHTTDEERVTEWVTTNARHWFVVRETDATRTHFQGVIKSDKNIRALRESIRRDFEDLSGNKGYSLKECDAGMIKYLCKGPSKEDQEDPEVIINNFVDNVDELHNAWWAEREKIEKRKKLTVLQELLQWHQDNTLATRQQLAVKAMEIVVERNQTVRKNIVVSWVDTCWFKLYKTTPWIDNV